jgi:translation initiation factor 3 subunit C
MQRFPQNAEVEKAERQRQLPFHMHVNLELLEAIHLTASMLLEIPSMAANAHEARKKVISKQFRRMLEFSERQVFTGPPENTRDHIMQASKFLANGDWKKARDMILAIKIWDLIPNVESIKDMLTAKIKEEGLRTYFFTYGNYYDSVGLTQLSAQFELPDATVYAVVSKMIINEELHASINKPTNVVILHRVEPSRLQFLALSFSDKASGFVEANEKLLDTKINAHKQAEREERGERNTGDRGNVQQRGKGETRGCGAGENWVGVSH